MTKKIPSLDGLRAVSILIVLNTHATLTGSYPKSISKFIPFIGDFGVTVFFVISGFLITSLLIKEKENQGKIDLGNFYIRRVLRIFPVYFLFLGVVLLIDNFQRLSIPQNFYLHALTYTTNFNLSEMWTYDGHIHWLLGHTWSLAVEEQFYLFWPFILLLDRKKVVWIICILLVLSPITRVMTVLFRPYKHFFFADFFNYSDSIMWGALIAYIWEYKSNIITKKLSYHWGIRVIVLVVLIGLNKFGNHLPPSFLAPFERVIVSAFVGYLMISVIVVKDDWVYKILNHRLVTAVGVISYSLYVWQQIFLYDANWLHGDVWYRQFPVNILIVFIVATLSYRLYEKQFLQLKKRFK